MKKWATTYQNKHLHLMKIHIGLAILYAVLSVFMIWLMSHALNEMGGIIAMISVYSIPTIVHLLLAWGAKNKSEISRLVSVAIFVFMFLMVPIGTIIAMALGLPATQWESEQNEN